MFQLNQSANTAGTSGIGSVSLPPAFLVAQFGPPRRGSDDGKVSGQYSFTDDHGRVFTLHDWKCTFVYLGADSGAPTPTEFWAGERPYTFTIGGNSNETKDGVNLPATVFREWLTDLHGGYDSSTVHYVEGQA